MRAQIDIPNHAELLRCILDGCIEAGRIMIASGAAPPGPTNDIELAEDKNEEWQLPDETARIGSGDCEDMVIWRAASLRASGEDPDATAEILQVGPRELHCCVRRGDGQLEDVWNDMREGTYSMGFSFGDVVGAIANPIAYGASQAGRIARGVAGAASGLASSINGGRGRQGYTGAGAGGAPNTSIYTSQPPVPTVPPQQGYPYPGQQGYPYPGQQGYPYPGQGYGGFSYPGSYGQYGGIPTAPAGYGYGGGYGGYPQEPYPQVPWYQGDVDDDDQDDDDQDDAPPPKRKRARADDQDDASN